MEENLLEPLPDFKLYTDRTIYIATFIGGPLVAGYLAAENFKQLGQTGKAKTTWIIAIVATIIIFATIFLIPGMEKVPNVVFPSIYTAVAQLLVQRFQGAAIKKHIDAGGQTYSTWRAVWIGLVIFIVFLVIIAAIILFAKQE